MLPFTIDEFFAVFAAYNRAIWPLQLLVYALTVAVLPAALGQLPWSGRAMALLLAGLWILNGLGYHLAYFAPVNPAAYAFAAIFVVQGLMFLWISQRRHGLALAFDGGWRGYAGFASIV